MEGSRRAGPSFVDQPTPSHRGLTSRNAGPRAFRSCRIRRQQSPRVHPGTSCRTLLIASCFAAGPSLIPAISTQSMAGSHRGLILALLSVSPNVAYIVQLSLPMKTWIDGSGSAAIVNACGPRTSKLASMCVCDGKSPYVMKEAGGEQNLNQPGAVFVSYRCCLTGMLVSPGIAYQFLTTN